MPNPGSSPRRAACAAPPTEAERRLWQRLRHWPNGRWRRQRLIGRYILDFYCAAARLAVELD
ncbi:MAG: DUF559 domain-containing protein, partial [Deltaproteobacteria bacterium]